MGTVDVFQPTTHTEQCTAHVIRCTVGVVLFVVLFDVWKARMVKKLIQPRGI
jgi:hypothetical protein